MESIGKDRSSRIGLVLVILGGLALLSSLGFFRGISHLVGALLLAFLGGLALRHYQRRHRVGALVAAFALFGLAAAAVAGALSGFFFLALLGAGFAALYAGDRERWWAIIPAGTLLTLAVVAALSEIAPRFASGSVLFLGLAATFLVLYRLPHDPKRWAIYPAVASLALAVLGLSAHGTWLLPLALVGAGAYLLYRRNGETHEAVEEKTVAEGVVGEGTAVEAAAPEPGVGDSGPPVEAREVRPAVGAEASEAEEGTASADEAAGAVGPDGAAGVEGAGNADGADGAPPRGPAEPRDG